MNKKKLFVVSDIHSFYDIFKKELDKMGFDPNNENHWLIVCGDVFDRGFQPNELLKFLMSLERKILIRGNHEYLLEELCIRCCPYEFDLANGTMQTINQLTNEIDKRNNFYGEQFQVASIKLDNYFKSLINFFETKNYIFVHSWIPVNRSSNNNYEYISNWREINFNDKKWEDATWANPFDMYKKGLNKTNKTIVFGHWHCSTGHKNDGKCKDEFLEGAIWEPYYGEGVIGIDKCTAFTGRCNIIVLEDEFLEEEN